MMSVPEWLPRTHSGVCVFTAAVGESAHLHVSIEHNANWAVAHGCSFSLFTNKLAGPKLHPQWEKVFATQHMLKRIDCRWLMFIDADAVVIDITRAPQPLLQRLEDEAMAAKPSVPPVLFGACNSPMGRGLDCDVFCCGRARRREGCSVGLRDDGPAAPYPCLINSGVYFLKRGRVARTLVAEWAAHQADQPEIFGEQESLNILKEAHPELIEVVGAQVMNTHTSFGQRLHSTENPHAAYDIALRLTTHFDPSPGTDKRLNQSLYARVALEAYGKPIGSQELADALEADVGECTRDQNTFICHPFARPPEHKERLGKLVARRSRQQLRKLLSASEQRYRTLNDVLLNRSAAAWPRLGQLQQVFG